MNKLNELAKQFHERAKAKGFWDEPRETGTLLMLMVSELSEALEADRKNKHCNWPYFVFDENNGNEFKEAFENNIKDTFEDEIADVFIRLLDFIGQRNIDIEKHIELKMKYNQLRAYKHGKAY
jgi:NTP pyrophosphatase (non-canonical NTP hydrolase)